MDIKILVGKTIEEAEQICKDSNYKTRITNEDGRSYVGTCDFNIYRVGFVVNKGVVTEANIG